ncbi:MAG: hypothetical protein GY822_17125 [Deltaproteobacteria bacterium]|nr:hypothetical protein [Deltaproteobacteria bacterium]
MSRLRLGDLLVKVGLVDEAQLKSALAMQRQYGGRLGNLLVDNGFLDEMMLWRGLSKQLGLPLISIPDLEVSRELLASLPKEFVIEHDIFPVHIGDRELTIATSDPSDIVVVDDLQARLGARVKTVLAPAREISWAIGFHYQGMRHPCPPPQSKGVSSGLDVKTGNDPVTQIPAMVQTQPPATPPPVMLTQPPVPHTGLPPGGHPAPTQPPMAVPTTPPLFGSYSMPPGAAQGGAPQTGGYSMPTVPMTGHAPASGAYQAPSVSADAAAHIARLEATLRETNEVLRYLVDTCVTRGVFSREEFLERMRRVQEG